MDNYDVNDKDDMAMKKYHILTLQAVLFTIFVAVITAFVAIYRQNTRSRATTEEQRLSIQIVPTSVSVASGDSFNLTYILNSLHKPIGFIRLTLKFNSNDVNLTAVDTQIPAGFNNLLPADLNLANSTGQLSFMIGAGNNIPDNKQIVQLPRLTFNRISNTPTQIEIDMTKSQIVFLDQTLAEVENVTPVTINSPTTRIVTPVLSVTGGVTIIPTDTPPAIPSLPKDKYPEDRLKYIIQEKK